MQLDIHIHNMPLSDEKLDKIIHLQERLMAKADELKAELVAANEATNEIASDLDDLVKRVGDGSLSPAEAEEVKTQMTALKSRLQSVAAVHTPGTPV